MNRFTLAAIASIVGTGTAMAGGLDRSGQGIDILFEEGDIVELSFGFVNPSVDGTDTTLSPFNPGQDNSIGNVADNFTTGSLAVKTQINERVSFALILDDPYGSDVSYGDGDTSIPSSVFGPAVLVDASALGGTEAIVNSFALTALGRYEFNNGFSVHGGLRYQEIEANVTLGGLAFGGLNGYNGDFQSDGAFGYVIGAAYERPEIALRVALTYNSKIDHELETTETLGGQAVTAGTSVTDVRAPESLNLDFQTGVAPGTLVFGSIRYARYEDLVVSPVFFDQQVQLASGTTNNSLTSIENSLDVELGVGRQFTDRFAASVAFGYSSSGDDDLVSPLAPTNGSTSIALGASYKVTEAVELSGGIRYSRLRDAQPETGTPDVARASFTGNSAVSVGFKIGYSF